MSPEGFARQGFSRAGLVSETFNTVLERLFRSPRVGARGATRFSTSSGVVSTMWTQSRKPNTVPLMARPQMLATNAHPSAAAFEPWPPGGGVASRIDMPWLTSGGKVTPVDGEEHPRTEL
jgi:hypothetical protein